jgi:hypothetical protein
MEVMGNIQSKNLTNLFTIHNNMNESKKVYILTKPSADTLSKYLFVKRESTAYLIKSIYIEEKIEQAIINLNHKKRIIDATQNIKTTFLFK